MMNFQKETKGTGMHPTNPGKDNTTKFAFHKEFFIFIVKEVLMPVF